MKKLHLLIVTMLILGLLLSACGTTEPEATEAPTEAVEAPTEAVVEEPTETEGPAPAADDKRCSGTKIVFFPGGSPGGPFATVVYNGAVAAAADLGADVEYVWSDWNPEQMVTQFAEAAATQPDGIAIMGHPGDDAFSAVVADARDQGIIVTSQNTTLPELEAMYSSSGFGYVGAELYSAGYALGAEAVMRFGLGEGDKAMVWGLLAQACLLYTSPSPRDLN